MNFLGGGQDINLKLGGGAAPSRFGSRQMKYTRGQMGPIGEDLISLTIIVLAIAFLLIALNTAITNHTLNNIELDTYRTAWTTADKLSTEWAYTDSSNTTHSRLLDVNKICRNYTPAPTGYELYYTITDLRENKKICSTGSSLSNTTKTAKIPVALRFDYNKVHPGILEVRIGR